MKDKTVWLVWVCLVLCSASTAWAQVPETMSYNGSLSKDGSPFDGQVELEFTLYDAATGGASQWSESFAGQDVDGGAFTVDLGATESLDGVLDGSVLWLEVKVDGEAMSPRTSVSSLPYALKSGDAASLGGVAAADVLAGLGGGGGGTAASITVDDTATGLGVTNLQEAMVEMRAMRDRIDELEAKTASVTVDAAGENVYFTGVNLHVRNGLGATDGDVNAARTADAVSGNSVVNGLGNLIVGYNESRGVGDGRGGSHNVVVGIGLNFSSYGALVTGSWNAITEPFSATIGGNQNSADGVYSALVGGRSNIAAHNGAATVGGLENEASGEFSSVSGGHSNTASGQYSAVAGGFTNLAEAAAIYGFVAGGRFNGAAADSGSVFGGVGNVSSGYAGSVLGGQANMATMSHSSVAGGRSNTASGPHSSVFGGSMNTASGDLSAVSGGQSNATSGFAGGIFGGRDNMTSSGYTVVSGGQGNVASSPYASVSAGFENTASGEHSSVSGGRNNTATMGYATVSGGSMRTADAADEWVAGTLAEPN